jgi:hypothetical protein
MGYMLSETGIASNLYRMFHVWFGPVRGGLAHRHGVADGADFLHERAVSVAGMAIGATVALPELLKRGYDKVMVTGVIQAGSSLGILIPPSVVLVLFAMIARATDHAALARGHPARPADGGALCLYIYIRCRIQPELGLQCRSRRARGRSPPVKSWCCCAKACMPIGVFGIMMTPLPHRRHQPDRELGRRRAPRHPRGSHLSPGKLNWKVLESTTRHTLMMSAACSSGSSWPRSASRRSMTGWARCARSSTSAAQHLRELDAWGILILMLLSFIVLGIFLDDTAMLVIVAPLYVPLVIQLGFDPIWFGILYTVTCQIAYITPPFGYNLFLMRAMAPPEISLMRYLPLHRALHRF